jgi:hypothetical protein
MTMPETQGRVKVTESDFKERLIECLEPYRFKVESVTGPGRSGAIASVYASHFLRIPYIPYGIPTDLRPLLIVDTAILTGRTLRKAMKKYGPGVVPIALYKEPPRVVFWYELGTF